VYFLAEISLFAYSLSDNLYLILRYLHINLVLIILHTFAIIFLDMQCVA